MTVEDVNMSKKLNKSPYKKHFDDYVFYIIKDSFSSVFFL